MVLRCVWNIEKVVASYLGVFGGCERYSGVRWKKVEYQRR